MAMIEHEPWIGSEYQNGMSGGQRIGIVGYSHWIGETDGNDRATLTREVLDRVSRGAERIRFFTAIRNSFDFKESQEFWNSVMFFNYLPDCIGGQRERFDTGTPEQVERANERFSRILSSQQPDKVLVFTRRGWASLTSSEEKSRIYDFGDRRTRAFGLRHPQGSYGEEMRQEVKAVLNSRSSQ